MSDQQPSHPGVHPAHDTLARRESRNVFAIVVPPIFDYHGPRGFEPPTTPHPIVLGP